MGISLVYIIIIL